LRLNFFRAHHSVRLDTLEQRLAAIKESVPLTTDRAIIDSSVLMITALAKSDEDHYRSYQAV